MTYAADRTVGAGVDAPAHIREIYDQVETIKRLSDRLISVGPWGLGLDGMLAFIPGANLAYGLGAGALLVHHAVKAEAHPTTIAKMVAYLAADNATDALPFLGWAVDMVFPGHLMAAKTLQKDIERRYGPMSPPKKRWWSKQQSPEPGPRKVGEGSAVPKR